MTTIQKWTAALLALCLLCGLCACGGKEKDTINARFSALYLSEFPTEYLEDPETYADQIDGFHLENFAQTFADYNAFKTYNVEIVMSNGNDYAVNVLDVQIEDRSEGKNGVYFSTWDDGAAVGIPANFTGEQTVYYQVVADGALSMDDVLKTLGEMHITVVYADAAIDTEDMELDLNNADLQQSVIRYGK